MGACCLDLEPWAPFTSHTGVRCGQVDRRLPPIAELSVRSQARRQDRNIVTELQPGMSEGSVHREHVSRLSERHSCRLP